MTKTPLILASSSRYRRELLDRLGLAYTTVSPDVDETPLAGEAPAALALRLAHLKAEAVAKMHPDAVVIGSDQVCDLEGTPLGKPHTFEKAVAQLKAMQGKRLVFHTAVCVIAPSAPVQDTVSDTVITMRARTLRSVTTSNAKSPLTALVRQKLKNSALRSWIPSRAMIRRP